MKWCVYKPTSRKYLGCCEKLIKNYTTDYALCEECEAEKALKEKDSNIEEDKNAEVFINKLSGAKDKIQFESIYKIMKTYFGLGDPGIKSDFDTLENAAHFIMMEFSHLNESSGNIFRVNDSCGSHIFGLTLSKQSLLHLVGKKNDGWLDDSILTFIVELLNLYVTYKSKSKICDGVIPAIVFGNPDDTCLSVDPNQTEYDHLKNVARCKDTKDKELHKQFCNQNCQFLMSPGHKGGSLCDIINFFTKVGEKFETYAVPLNWCGLHWVLLHIVMRSTK